MEKQQSFIFSVLPFCSHIAYGVFFVCIPLLAINMGANPLELGGLGFTFTLSFISVCIFFGKLFDRYRNSCFLWLSCLILTFLPLALSFSNRLYHLFLSIGIMGIASAMLWPSVEALLAMEGGELLIKRISRFNVSWCSGLVIGSFIGGYLFQINAQLPFYFSSLAFLISTFFVFASTKEVIRLSLQDNLSQQDNSSKTDLIPAKKSTSSYLYIAWIANFVIWFSAGIIRYIFPKLSISLGFSSFVLGILFACISLAQTITFYALGKLSFWYYRKSIPIFAQIAAICAFIIIFFSDSMLIFIGAFAILGMALGITTLASLFYTLNTPQNKGVRAGIHEFFLMSGGLFGPLTGGALATKYTLRTPYLLVIIIIGVSIAIQIFLNFKIMNKLPRNENTKINA